MTIESTTNRNSYSGNGSLKIFAYTFKVFDESHLLVYLRNDTTLVETQQVLTTHYTVSGVGADTGGNVTFITAPASGYTVVIKRQMDLKQLTDLVPGGDFRADDLENSLDKIVMMLQQLDEILDRAIILPLSTSLANLELPEPTSGPRYLRWNSAVDAIEAVDLETTAAAISAYGETLIDDQNSREARSTLEIRAVRDLSRNLIIHNPLNSYQVDVDADEIIVEDSNNDFFRVTSVNLTINIATSGLNGLDTGSEQVSTWYFIWVVWNPATQVTGGLLSESASSPTLPSGFTFKALVGAIYNDSGSDFRRIYQTGNKVVQALTQPLTAGNEITATAIDLTTYVPSIVKTVLGYADAEYVSASQSVQLGFYLPVITWVSYLQWYSENTANDSVVCSFEFPLKADALDSCFRYELSGSGSQLKVFVTGFTI